MVQILDVKYTSLKTYATGQSLPLYYIETENFYEVYTTLSEPLNFMVARATLCRSISTDDLTDFETSVKDDAVLTTQISDGMEPQLEIVQTPSWIDPLLNPGFEDWNNGTFFSNPSVNGTQLADNWYLISVSNTGTGSTFISRSNEPGQLGSWCMALTGQSTRNGNTNFYIAQTVSFTASPGSTLRFSIDVKTTAAVTIKPWVADNTSFGNFSQGVSNALTDGTWNTITIDKVLDQETSLLFGFYLSGTTTNFRTNAFFDNATLTKL